LYKVPKSQKTLEITVLLGMLVRHKLRLANCFTNVKFAHFKTTVLKTVGFNWFLCDTYIMTVTRDLLFRSKKIEKSAIFTSLLKIKIIPFNIQSNCLAFTSYNPSLPFTMKFPGPSFCDGKQKLMVIASLPPTVRKVACFPLNLSKFL
jgi:hypothetical protein